MEIHEIRYFLALSRTLNFRRAAEICNISQPALTRAIQNLEDKLGAGPLLNRERANTHLTELGHIMKPYFEQVVDGIEQAQTTATSYRQSPTGTLTLGLMCTLGPARMIDFFSRFHAKHSAMQLYLRDAPAAALEDLLSSGELGIALYCKPGRVADRLHTLPLFNERFVIAVAPDHPFAARDQVRFADLHQQRYLHRANCEYNEALDGILSNLGVEPLYPYESERDDWIQSMVLAGLGCTAIPEFAATIPGLVLRPLVEPAVTRTINLVTVRGRRHTAPIGAFVMAAKQYDWPGRVSEAERSQT